MNTTCYNEISLSHYIRLFFIRLLMVCIYMLVQHNEGYFKTLLLHVAGGRNGVKICKKLTTPRKPLTAVSQTNPEQIGFFNNLEFSAQFKM